MLSKSRDLIVAGASAGGVIDDKFAWSHDPTEKALSHAPGDEFERTLWTALPPADVLPAPLTTLPVWPSPEAET
jgi:hypothetical protein